MAAASGKAIMGEDPPLNDELVAFGKAIASGDPKAIAETREALRVAAGNDHAVLDAAAVVGFFSSITKIVDFSGHYADDLMKFVGKMEKILSGAREVRMAITAPFRWALSPFRSNKPAPAKAG